MPLLLRCITIFSLKYKSKLTNIIIIIIIIKSKALAFGPSLCYHYSFYFTKNNYIICKKIRMILKLAENKTVWIF